jgi:hypothetical protein
MLHTVAKSGSINEITKLFGYLFSTYRVETFTLNLLLVFWKYFPEAAQETLRSFLRYGYWLQLLLLMELAKGKKFRKELVSSALKLMKEQWDADLVTLRSCSDQVDPTVGGRAGA